MARRLDHRAEPKPEIVISARVGPLDDPETAVIANTLANDANAFDIARRKGWEIDVDQRLRLGCEFEQGTEDALCPNFSGGERYCVAHPFARIGLAECNRRDAGKCTLHRRGDGTGVSDVLGQVRTTVDPRKHDVGWRILHDMSEGEHPCVGRRPSDREAALVVTA